MGAASILEKYETLRRKQNADEKEERENRMLEDPGHSLPACSWPHL